MTKTAILKLGGSIITEKRQGKPVLKAAFVKRVAKELALTLKQKPQLKLILLHGAGSFGHPLVYKYRLKNRRLKSDDFRRVGEVLNALRELGTQLAKMLTEAGLPLVPLQTSSLFQRSGGKTVLKNFSVIETIAEHGGIPLLGGDLALGDKKAYVLSADEIAVILAKKIKNAQIFFASDVDGVYKSFPAQKGEQPIGLLNRNDLKSFLRKNAAKDLDFVHDVSGGMMGKLKKMLALKRKKAFVFNGQKPSLINKSLMGEKVKGTTIWS